jgi:hypothetical protein
MEPLTAVYLLGGFLFLVGAAVSRLDVGRCPECPHCRAEALAKEARERATVGALERRLEPVRCPRCGRIGQHDHDS